MPNPLDQVTYNQDAGYLPVNLVAGDDLNIAIDLPFDITTYSFSGSVLDSFGTQLVPFTVTISQLTPTGEIIASLTGVQTATITTGSTYYVQWTVSGSVRTFLSGPIVAAKP